jgi:methionyl-tRNA synthetase
MRRLLALLCALALCAACSEPPQKEIDRAQGAIDAARAAGAEQYATTEFGAATTSLQQAHDAVAQRDYRLALSRALDASERAQQAARQAADGKARARSEAESIVSTTATAVQQLRSAIKAIEPSRPPAAVLTAARQTAASADSAVQKARTLLKQERYLDAGSALNGVHERINEQIQALNDASKARAGKRRT